ncbi:hypothetical protein SteCoe_39907 [Stentor coeruleus]|uniref:Uncharacterized protein n=1 Tax=Stentor coeruleus TaxID=5963 RepID=A0A1R2AKI2_9CILI|nr:hypothetical protein SteCoe_39907 [Stentor coeruleus]
MVIFGVLCLNFIYVHSENFFSSTDIYANGISPEPRTNPSLAVDSSGKILYLFGGHSKYNFLNDLWTFNLETLMWNFVYAQDNSPSNIKIGPRSNSVSFFRKKTQEFCIFGGKSDISMLNDFWCFSLLFTSWRSFEYPTFLLSQRFKARYLEYNDTENLVIIPVDFDGINIFM